MTASRPGWALGRHSVTLLNGKRRSPTIDSTSRPAARRERGRKALPARHTIPLPARHALPLDATGKNSAKRGILHPYGNAHDSRIASWSRPGTAPDLRSAGPPMSSESDRGRSRRATTLVALLFLSACIWIVISITRSANDQAGSSPMSELAEGGPTRPSNGRPEALLVTSGAVSDSQDQHDRREIEAKGSVLLTCRQAANGEALAGVRLYRASEPIAGPSDEQGELRTESPGSGDLTLWVAGWLPVSVQGDALSGLRPVRSRRRLARAALRPSHLGASPPADRAPASPADAAGGPLVADLCRASPRPVGRRKRTARSLRSLPLGHLSRRRTAALLTALRRGSLPMDRCP